MLELEWLNNTYKWERVAAKSDLKLQRQERISELEEDLPFQQEKHEKETSWVLWVLLQVISWEVALKDQLGHWWQTLTD
jgi:hypothetical protein